MDKTAAAPVPDQAPQASGRFWPEGWWRWMEFRIGIIPLPVFIVMGALIAGFVVTGKISSEISMAIVVFSFFGFLCAEIGKRIPIIRNIGAAAIFATFIPSALVYYKVLPEPIIKMTTEFTKTSNFLYLFIASIIVGSILSMNRKVLIKGFLKIFVPLAVGSIAAMIVGTLVGTALGLGTQHTFFYIVVPIMAGGVGEGAIPLSVGYGEILHQDQGELFATILPAVMLGSLTAIVLAGTLNYVGKRYPKLTGEGRLQPGRDDQMDPHQEEITGHMDVTHIAAAGVTARHALRGGYHVPTAVRPAGAGGDAVHRGRHQADAGGVAAVGAGSVRRLQILLDGGNVSAAVCDRRGAHAVGQADGGVYAADPRHHRRHGRDVDGHGGSRRALPQDVSDRKRDHQRLPQRPGRNRRRGHSHGCQPHAADAVCPDRHPHRRCDHRDAGAHRARAHDMRPTMNFDTMLPRARLLLCVALGALCLQAVAQDVIRFPAKGRVPAGYPAPYAATIAAAEEEGQLVIYSTTDIAIAAPLIDDFQALYPRIEVRYQDMNSNDLNNAYLGDLQASPTTADVLWSSAMDLQFRLASAGEAQAYDSPEIAALPDWAVWKNVAFGTTFEPIVIVYNKRLLAGGARFRRRTPIWRACSPKSAIGSPARS